MEDEERSHRGESIGRAGDQCAAEKETEMKKKKISGVLRRLAARGDEIFQQIQRSFPFFYPGKLQ